MRESCSGAERQLAVPDSESGHRSSVGSTCLFTLAAPTMLDAVLTHTFLSVVREEAEGTVTTAW